MTEYRIQVSSGNRDLLRSEFEKSKGKKRCK